MTELCPRCGSAPRTMTHVCPPPGTFVPSSTASADVDWEKAWKLAAPVVVAARRFVNAEAEGNAALIEDAHFQLLRALADYSAGASL